MKKKLQDKQISCLLYNLNYSKNYYHAKVIQYSIYIKITSKYIQKGITFCQK